MLNFIIAQAMIETVEHSGNFLKLSDESLAFGGWNVSERFGTAQLVARLPCGAFGVADELAVFSFTGTFAAFGDVVGNAFAERVIWSLKPQSRQSESKR